MRGRKTTGTPGENRRGFNGLPVGVAGKGPSPPTWLSSLSQVTVPEPRRVHTFWLQAAFSGRNLSQGLLGLQDSCEQKWEREVGWRGSKQWSLEEGCETLGSQGYFQ